MSTAALGDRMKRYEAATNTLLPPRTHTILRVDGRAFHTYLRGAAKPYDYGFMADMDAVACYLAATIAGTQFAYVQSDEISLCLVDYQELGTQPWFAGEVQKICSVAAGMASAYLARIRPNADGAVFPLPHFDGRVFTIADPVEVANYFLWRQRDAVRNSVTMAAQAKFSHAALHGVPTDAMQEMLWSQHGINWNDYPEGAKRGRLVVRIVEPRTSTWEHPVTGETQEATALRSRWQADPAPGHLERWVGIHLPPMHERGPVLEVTAQRQAADA